MTASTLPQEEATDSLLHEPIALKAPSTPATCGSVETSTGHTTNSAECCTSDFTAVPARKEGDYLHATYTHSFTVVERLEEGGITRFKSLPRNELWRLRTHAVVPKTGLLLVGIGGNNGTTLAAGLLANKQGLHWEDHNGVHTADWLGSVAMCGTMKLGLETATGRDIFVPVRSLLPMLHPNDLVLGGWDISSASMSEAMQRARVLPLEVQRMVKRDMDKITVWPGIYRPDFIATNQGLRADKLLPPAGLSQSLEAIRGNIRSFKKDNNLDKVIVLWTANTERFAEHVDGIHDTPINFLQGIEHDHPEIAPSALYAAAAILEGCSYINGSPQNTFCKALVEMAKEQGVYLIGDDLKTGQTKIKSVMVDYLVNTALKPTSIVSYNHLGNNDGLNLSSERQFRSKEVTKASVVDDMIASNAILYPTGSQETASLATMSRPDHLIVIKYVPAVGDSKRALDEYTAKIFMNGTQTVVMHNTCEDSLLAAPIILDLVLFCELLERIHVQKEGEKKFSQLHPLGSILSLFLKAPQVPPGAPVINALFPQREALLSFIRAAAGLPPIDYLALNHRTL